MEMASNVKFPYQRLKHEDLFGDYEEKERRYIVRPLPPPPASSSSRSWHKFKRVHLRKRYRVKVPSLRRFLRKRVKLVYAAYAKVLKRLKESQSHFGDLFAGNYLFLQVNPTSLKCLEKAYHNNYGLPSSRYSLPRN